MNPQRKSARTEAPPAAVNRVEKLIHLALPVRLVHMKDGQRGAQEFACTYDIHPRGARLLGGRDVKVGDLLTVERGRLRSVCQVVWVADPDSALRGQFTVESFENGRIPWEEELRQVDEQYLPVAAPGLSLGRVANNGAAQQNRRRRPRYAVSGGADLAEVGGQRRGEGRLEQISELGCLIASSSLLSPGTALRLVLNMCDVSVGFRGHVRYHQNGGAMGVEFQEIRQGDRPLLDYVLEKLRKPRQEDFADLEVITEVWTAAG